MFEYSTPPNAVSDLLRLSEQECINALTRHPLPREKMMLVFLHAVENNLMELFRWSVPHADSDVAFVCLEQEGNTEMFAHWLQQFPYALDRLLISVSDVVRFHHLTPSTCIT